jgi:hypothetical protein
MASPQNAAVAPFPKPAHYKAFHLDLKSALGNYRVRNWLWYIVVPLVVLWTLTPGLLISIPPAEQCDSADVTAFSPRRVTIWNAMVHALLTWLIIIGVFYWGARSGFAFPFTSHVIDALIVPPPK